MRRLQKRQLKYGISTGVFIFGFLWLVALFFVGESSADVERWRAGLWLVLGMHYIEIHMTHFQAFASGTVSASAVFDDVPVAELRLLPPLCLAIGALYTGAKVSPTRRPRYIFQNAGTVLLGYLPAFAVAFMVSNINPGLQTIVGLTIILPVALYIGAQLIEKTTGSLPMFGFARLGTILLIGFLILVVVAGLLVELGPALGMMGLGVGLGGLTLYFRRQGTGQITRLIWKNKLGILLFALLGLGLLFALGAVDNPSNVSFSEFGSPSGSESNPESVSTSEVEELIFEYVNEERQSQGLSELQLNDDAVEKGRAHAEDMAENDYFDHTSLDGETQEERYAFCNGGENIAQTWFNQDVQVDDEVERYTTEEELAEGLFNQWMNSTPHREDGIRGEWWDSGGPAVAVTDSGKVYAVFVFCQ